MSSNVIAMPAPQTETIETPAGNIDLLPAPKPKKPRVVKPRIRQYKETRAKRYNLKEGAGLIALDPSENYFLISFPETILTDAVFAEALKAIPEISQWHRVPMKVEADSPAVSEEFKQIWRVRKSNETLALVAKFARKFKFDTVGDILMQAQLNTDEAKELEKMSYAKSAPNSKLPKLPTWTKEDWKKHNLSGDYVAKLKPLKFQPAGFAYAIKTKKTFIADEMGLGKTIQALLVIAYVLHNLRSSDPWLIVVPASVKINWYRETRKWLGKRTQIGIARNERLEPLERSEKKKPYTEAEKKKFLKAGIAWLRSKHVVIVNYDRIHKYYPYLKEIKFKGFVFDESHYCKGLTLRTRKCIELVQEVNPEYVLNLTGTPVMNSPKELIRQLQLLDRIAEFGGPVNFLNRFCDVVDVDMSKLPPLPKPNEDGSTAVLGLSKEDQDIRDEMVRKMYQNQIELSKQLRSLCYVRREKDDVLDSLPEKTRSTVFMDIDNRKEYDACERDLIAYLQNKVVSDERFQKKIKKLSKEEKVRAIKERRDEVGYSSSRAEALVRLENLKQIAARGKLTEATDWIGNAMENGEKIVAFTRHRDIMQTMETAFPDCVTVAGGQSDQSRQDAVDKFQTDPKTKLFIGSIRAAGVGITLTKSRMPVFLELDWNPAIHDQAEDRCHRIGQKNAVNAYYLIAKNTVEERIARLIEGKRRLVDATSDGDPLKSASTGGIITDLVAELTGFDRKRIENAFGAGEKEEDSIPKVFKKKSKSKSTKKPSAKRSKSSSKKSSKSLARSSRSRR